MKKLTIIEKKKITGGASLMGIATGILTITSLSSLILDLFKRYFTRNSTESVNNYESFLNSNNSEYFIPQMDFQKNSNYCERNRITIF